MSKLIDLLYEDPQIANQKYSCISFISPEHIIKNKEEFYFEKFLNNWDLNKSSMKFAEFLSFISYKYKVDNSNLLEDFESFMKSEGEKMKDYSCSEDYKNYIDKHEKSLEEEFNCENNFNTNVRGIKVRGCFSTQEEAELRCKILREIDPNHDVYVGPVGMWMPWHPDAYKTNRVEYLEKELNELMHEKKKNEDKAAIEFNKRVHDAKENAIEENKNIARETGNKLTQNVDVDGNLVNMQYENNGVSVSDIEKELFESKDVRLKDDKEIKMKT